MKYLRTNPFPLSKCIVKFDFFLLALDVWQEGINLLTEGSLWFSGDCLLILKKTAKLCNSVDVMCHKRVLQKLGKRGWPWTCPLTLNDAVFPCIKDSLSFRWWLAAEVSGREKTNTALHSTSPKRARIQKNLVGLGCVSSCGLDGDRLTLPDTVIARFLCLWLNLTFFCQTQRWSACSSQWRKSWRDSTAKARKATTRWGRRDFILSVWFVVVEHESRNILISAKHSQAHKQVLQKQSLSKIASDSFLFLLLFCSSWALLKLKSTRCKSAGLKTWLLLYVWTRMKKKYCRASPGKHRLYTIWELTEI